MKKLILAIFCAYFLSACASGGGGSKVALPKVDPALPALKQLQFLSSQTAIAFEWQALYNAPIRGIYVYKADNKNEPLELIATIEDKYKTHFLDTNLQPSKKYYYVFKTFNAFGQSAQNAAHIEAATKPPIEALPFIQSIPGLAGRVKLIWRPHPNPSVKGYEVQRASSKDMKFEDYASLDNRLRAEFIDEDLRPNESFLYRVYAVDFEGIRSKPSQVVKSTTKSLPPQPKHLKASQDLANKIKLSWDSIKDKEFAYFNIYEKSFMGEKIIAKSIENSYTLPLSGVDESAQFAVSMVDSDGLESKLTPYVAGKTATLPKPPVLIQALSEDAGIKIEWIKGGDRAISYILKRSGNGPDAIFKGLKGTSFLDTKADPKKSYEYELQAVDKDGLISKESKAMKSSVK